MTGEGLRRLAALIAEEYPGADFTAARLEMWTAVLADLADEDAARALVLHLRGPRSAFPPHPGELLERVRGPEATPERLLEEEAEEALRLIETRLSDTHPIDLTPVVNAVVRAMGGSDAVCMEIVGGEWKYRRQEARTLYKALRRRGVSAEQAAPLVPETVRDSENNRPNWRVDPATFLPPVPEHVAFPDRAIPGLPEPLRRPALPDGSH